MDFSFRDARPDDLVALLELENLCFEHDRLSPRSFQWMIARAHASLAVAEAGGRVMGYALLLFHRGTSLARLYSIAIAPGARGHGLGKALLAEAERRARDHDCAYLRLEVRPDNLPPSPSTSGSATAASPASTTTTRTTPRRCATKRIVQRPLDAARAVPYYQQSTEFTCGPACLMMAMAGPTARSRGARKCSCGARRPRCS